jgi:ABC-2 type transport system permease protein
LRKELLQIRRDRKILPMLLVAPVVQLVLLGYAATFDVKNIPLAVCDLDRSEESRTLARAFMTSGYFRIAERPADMREIDALMTSNRARMAVIIPAGYGRDLSKGRPPPVSLISDGTDTMTAAAGGGYARMIISEEINRGIPASAQPGAKPPTIKPELRIWYNQELKSSFFMVPAIFALLLSLIAMAIPSMAIVKEKELGTIEQLYVSPLRPYQLIVGKMLPFVLISFVNVTVVTAIAHWWFGVPFRGSLLNLFLAASLFLLSSLGLGLLISTLVATQQQAMMISIFIVMLPSILLSGFAFPIDNIPATVRPLSYILPVTYLINILRGLLLRGAGFADLWVNYAALLALGTLILSFSILRFRKTLG